MIYLKQFAQPEKNSRKNLHHAQHQAGLELLEAGLFSEYGLTFLDLSREISLEEKGKPFLTNYPQIYFNISHSAGAAACGISQGKIGIDIEKIRPFRLRSTRRILSRQELAFLEGSREEDKNREFFRLWTLKESYAKALGLGLSLDFTQIEFALSPAIDEPPSLTHFGEEIKPCPWKFFQQIWKNSYILSCCSQEVLSDKEIISP